VQSKVDTYSADSCTALRYLVDPERDVTVPVGVILSNQEEGRVWFRLPHAGEEIAGVSLAAALPYLEMARAQIEAWLRAGTLPYTSEPLPPLSGAWWEQVRRLMQWRVRLDLTRPVDCRSAEAELEQIYRALVSPPPAASEALDRIEPAAAAVVAD